MIKSFLSLLIVMFFASCGSNRVGPSESVLERMVQVNLWKQREEKRIDDIRQYKVQIVEAMKIRSGETVVDLGAGRGLFVETLMEKVGKKGKVVAVDISPGMVSHLNNLKDQNSWINLNVIQSDLLGTNLRSQLADKVLLCESYQQISVTSDIIQDIKRVLKPGGLIFIIDSYRTSSEISSDAQVNRNRTKFELIQAFQEQGFINLREHYVGLKQNFMIEFRVSSNKR